MNPEQLDLAHLHPGAREHARLPDDERVRRVRAERWIGYPRATAALRRLEELWDWPRRQRMPNLLLAGPTNNGKSMIIEKFRRTSEARVAASSGDRLVSPIPLVVMQMPSEPSVTRFYAALLEACGSPAPAGGRSRPRAVDLEQTAMWWLTGNGLRILVIDELHNVLAGNASRRREFLNLLRQLGNQLRVPLVGVGTHDAYLAVRSDDQLENRFQPLVLPRWQADTAETRSLLASFAASFPLRRPSDIAHPEMAEYLLARSEGTIGELATLLSAAAATAISSGEEAINAETLAATDYLGPSERRRVFERALG